MFVDRYRADRMFVGLAMRLWIHSNNVSLKRSLKYAGTVTGHMYRKSRNAHEVRLIRRVFTSPFPA